MRRKFQAEEHWDKIWPTKYGQYIRKHRKMYAGVRPHLKGSILDIGVGVTDMYQEGDDVTGIDISEECIRLMVERHPWGKWSHEDIFDMPEMGMFDTVVAANILEHFDEQEPIINILKFCCRDDGTVLIILPKENYDKTHVHPKWDIPMIENRVLKHFVDGSYDLYAGRWWIVKCQMSQ